MSFTPLTGQVALFCPKKKSRADFLQRELIQQFCLLITKVQMSKASLPSRKHKYRKFTLAALLEISNWTSKENF